MTEIQTSMESWIGFSVAGLPVPQGNLVRGRFGGVHEADPKLKSWRDTLVTAMIDSNGGRPILFSAVEVRVEFVLPYLKKHYGTGKNQDRLKANVPRMPITKPDLDKLQRAVGDALTQAGVIFDDCQIVSWVASKWYGSIGGATIGVWPVEVAGWGG